MIEAKNREDMISELPEDLLVMILGLVPTKDAIATMFLSKRWLSIWTMVRTLEYKDRDADDDNYKECKKSSVWNFLNKSMQLHKAPVIDYLSVKLGRSCPTSVDFGKLIAKALSRCLRELEFKLLWSSDPTTSLPRSMYSSESLVNLTLSHKILVDVPSPACLPSLKNLNLIYVVYKNEDSLISFLSICPVLEGLKVERVKDDNMKNFTIKVPCLLKLIYIDEEDTGSFLVFDTPALTTFVYLGYSCSIENMPCVEQACIHLGPSFPNINKFLRSFSQVLFLKLVLIDEMIVSWRTIKFSRLEICKIHPCDSNWMGSLLGFLEKTPKLKFLIVDYESTHRPPHASVWWSQRISDPECLSSSLEKFELIDYGGRKEQKELVEFILTTSKCLKTATISLRSTLKLEDEDDDTDEDEDTDDDDDDDEDTDEDADEDEDDDKDKETMMEELKAIPRVSITSHLLFIT